MASPSDFPDHGPARILVLEDDPAITELIRILLGGEGFDAVFAASGRRARELARHNPPALLIADLHIQGAETLSTVVRDIRAQCPHPLPMLLTSATHDQNACAVLGAYDFIAKPFDVDNFVDAVRRGLTPGQPAAA